MDSVNFPGRQRSDTDSISNRSTFLDCDQSSFLSNSSVNQPNNQPNNVVHQSTSYNNPLTTSIHSSDSSHVDRSRLYRSENDVAGSTFNLNQSTNNLGAGDSTPHAIRQSEQYRSNNQPQTKKEVEGMSSSNNTNSNIDIMQDLESMTFPQQNPRLVSPENLSIMTKTEDGQDPTIFKCTNCCVTFPSRSSFISHLTCSSGSSGNCIGGMPTSNTSTPGIISNKSMADAIRHSLNERYGSVGFINVTEKERCEEVSSSTGKLHTKPHQPVPFSHLLTHQCTWCRESFGSVETLRYHRTFCRAVSHTGITTSDHPNLGRSSSLWHPPKPGEPELIDLTRSRSSSPPEYKPCLSPQSASDLQRVPCEVCGKTYKNKYTLKTHYRVHSEQRPFTCSVCLKRFKEKGVLKSHEKTHSEERPFSCAICFKCFKARGTLKTHQKQIHPGMI